MHIKFLYQEAHVYEPVFYNQLGNFDCENV